MSATPGSIAAAGLLVLVLGAMSYGTYEHIQVLKQSNKEKADKVTDLNAQVTGLESQLTLERDARAEEKRRTDLQRGIANDTQRQLELQASNHAAAVAATDRMWDQAAAAGRAAQAACYPTPAQGSASAPSADMVPAELYRGAIAGGRHASNRADDLADEADKRRKAGIACERSYDGLTP